MPVRPDPEAVDKDRAGIARVSNDALELLSRGEFNLDEGYWVTSYLLQGSFGLVAAQPGHPAGMTSTEGDQWYMQKQPALEKLPTVEYCMVVAFAFARALEQEPDIEHYYRFGIDVLRWRRRGLISGLCQSGDLSAKSA